MKTSKYKNEELILFFLVTRTYEELYNSYIFNNFKFKYIKENKEITITDFINLDKKIEKIRKKLEKEKKEENENEENENDNKNEENENENEDNEGGGDDE